MANWHYKVYMPIRQFNFGEFSSFEEDNLKRQSGSVYTRCHFANSDMDIYHQNRSGSERCEGRSTEFVSSAIVSE